MSSIFDKWELYDYEILNDLVQYDRLKKKLCKIASEKIKIKNGQYSQKVHNIHIKKNNDVSFIDKNGKTNLTLKDFLYDDFFVIDDLNAKRSNFYNSPELRLLIAKAEENHWNKLEQEQFDEKAQDKLDDFLNLEF